MARAIIVLFIAVMAIFFLVTVFAFDFATSVVPGWHVTLYPPQTFFYIYLCPWLIFVTGCFIIFKSKGRKIPQSSTIAYVLLTLPLPILLFYYAGKDIQVTPEALSMMPRLFLATSITYLIGQLFFLLISAKNMRKKHA